MTTGPQRLLKVYADRFLLAPGGSAQLLAFENNDLPGVYSGRALSALIRRYRLAPGERVALVGRGRELDALARLVEEHGSQVAAVVDHQGHSRHPAAIQGDPLKAHGGNRVKALTVILGRGGTQRIRCDAIALVAPPAPSFELARQGGARVRFDDHDGLFVVDADAVGRTAQAAVIVAGEVTGAMDAVSAWARGEQAGAAVAAELAGADR